MTLLDVRSVTVAFGATVAVDAVDLTAYRGEVCAVIGPNGAGKSTLLDAIAGTVPLASGRVVLDGEDITRASAHRRAGSGLARAFQTPALLGPTPLDEVMLAATRGRGVLAGLLTRPSRAAREDAGDALRQVDLEESLWRVPSASLGLVDQRRVELARAIATRPRLLTLDEPAAGLPSASRAAFAELLASLPGTDLGVVLVEHDMALVAAVAHVVVALDRGAVVAVGPYASVAADPVVRQSYLGEEAA